MGRSFSQKLPKNNEKNSPSAFWSQKQPRRNTRSWSFSIESLEASWKVFFRINCTPPHRDDWSLKNSRFRGKSKNSIEFKCIYGTRSYEGAPNATFTPNK